jgi:hypothetical protein
MHTELQGVNPQPSHHIHGTLLLLVVSSGGEVLQAAAAYKAALVPIHLPTFKYGIDGAGKDPVILHLCRGCWYLQPHSFKCQILHFCWLSYSVGFDFCGR